MSRAAALALGTVLCCPVVGTALSISSVLAPAFILPDAQGRAFALASVLGRERLLVLAAPPAAYLATLRLRRAQLRDRDLRVLALLPPGDSRLRAPSTAQVTLLADSGGQVAARLGLARLNLARLNLGAGLLIGKDRGIKARYATLPSLQQVLITIDGMPMRQQERQQRGR